MEKVNYLLLDMSVLPEVYVKVIEAKGYLQSGEAANASQAVKMAGISCSAYYKYKDKIFEYSEQGDDATTINAKLQDNAGVLSSVMNELYLAGANILVVNQSKQNKKEFLRGYDYMLSKIEPEAVICFGAPFYGMRGNIILVDYRSSRKVVDNGRSWYICSRQTGRLHI